MTLSYRTLQRSLLLGINTWRRSIFLVFLTAGTFEGQAMKVIASKVTCPDCEVELVPVGHIVLNQDFRINLSPTTDKSGRLYAVGADSAGNNLFVLDPKGKVTARFARQGMGPGEVMGPHLLVPDGTDSLFVFDVGALRLYTSQGKYLSSLKLPTYLVIRALRMGAGLWIINAEIGTPDRAGWPIHIMRTDGTITKSFGAEVANARPDRWIDMFRHLAPASDATFWAGRVTRYQIDLYDANGTLLKSLVRKADWFPPWTRYTTGVSPAIEKPEASLNGIQQESPRRLWTLSGIPAPNWEKVRSQPKTPSGKESADISDADLNKYIHTVIELLDSETGEVLARKQVPFLVQFTSSAGGIVMTRKVDAEGIEEIDLWRLHVKTTMRR
jgi:hypothetical protein